jgi:hypothetical protein
MSRPLLSLQGSLCPGKILWLFILSKPHMRRFCAGAFPRLALLAYISHLCSGVLPLSGVKAGEFVVLQIFVFTIVHERSSFLQLSFVSDFYPSENFKGGAFSRPPIFRDFSVFG